jgi:LPXTG-motif cell wall-anchored protein
VLAENLAVEIRQPSVRSYHWLVIAGLGLAAIVVGAAGFLVVRRKTPS